MCLARRSSLSTAERLAADTALSDTIARHSAFLHADLVLAFSPVRGEPDLSLLCELAAMRHIPVAYPRCEGKDMTFHVIRKREELVVDRFGIPAPAANAPVATPTKRTLCLLPGLAAGLDGTRLGYGGGFYDRFLDTFPGITLFPIYHCLLFPTLPTESTDQTVHHIVTEKGEIRLHVQADPGASLIP